jgi:hypothetical protein
MSTQETTANKIDWKSLADAVEKLAMAKMEYDIVYWKNNRSMRAMLISDAGDALDVCEYLAAGNWVKAEQKLWDIDTAAREYIYNWIQQVAGSEFFNTVGAK